MDVALHQLGYAATWQLNSGGGAERQARSGHYSVAPVQTFPTADGWVFVMCVTQKFWEALTQVIGRPELAKDPRFLANRDRFANRELLTSVLDEVFEAQPTEAWLKALAGVLPVAPVFDVAQAMANPFMAEAGMLRKTPHPANPGLTMMASPIKVDGDRGPQAVCPPMGADNAEVLGEAAPARSRA
jgi:crotonobetainyl-CoA:carnitine CoA-transferase CaiB-like acyl-CoA transferase